MNWPVLLDEDDAAVPPPDAVNAALQVEQDRAGFEAPTLVTLAAFQHDDGLQAAGRGRVRLVAEQRYAVLTLN